MSELDVESEVYERLYGLPRRDQRNGHAPDQPVVIADRELPAGNGDLEATTMRLPPVRRRRPAGRDLGAFAHRAGEGLGSLGHELGPRAGRLGRGIGALLAAAAAAAAARARHVASELGPGADTAIASARRHPAPTGALIWALLAAPVVAVLLASSGASPATMRLRPESPRVVLPLARPAPKPHRATHHVAPPPVTTADSSPPPSAVTTISPPTTTSQRHATRPPKHRTSTPRRRATPPAPRAPVVRRPTSRPAPVRKPTTSVPTTTPPPTTTPGGTTAPTGAPGSPGE